ncbi:MAG: ATP-dependent RNA helicase HrpA [Gammaproteobacteria bacterium]
MSIFHTLRRQVTGCMLSDRRRLLRRLEAQRQQHLDPEQLNELEQVIRRSCETAQRRAALAPKPLFREPLPILEQREAILSALRTEQVLVVCGETGCGKSTQLPQICLAAGRGVYGMIGHTQPRRIAARSLCTRIAHELNTEVEQIVGYQVRFNQRVGPDTLLKLMTDGILLMETQKGRGLEAYDTLIIDEAHERTLNIDFLLGYLKTLLPRRPELKVIITSATIDPDRLSRHFNGAPIIEVSGRTYPVELRYRPIVSEDEGEGDLQQAIATAVDEVAQEASGDILIFLPGEREIRETTKTLRKHLPPDTDILSLFARLSSDDQDRVFQAHTRRRIILATNIAETSLTVPGIRFVIDTGLARIKRYNPRRKVQRLPVEPISQASAEQRKGRCGRVAAGVCIRLYSEDDFAQRPPFTDPEIRRASLASVILRLKYLKFQDIEAFPFIDPPEERYIKDGYQLLQELMALSEERALTPIGILLARLPIDPRIARMLVAAHAEGCLAEILIIAAALSVQDPRERPTESQAAADEAHERFRDPHSDFLGYLNLWRFYQEQIRHLSKNKLRKLCRSQFLSYPRMHEWADVHSQLRALMHDFGYETHDDPAPYPAMHRALLTGLLGNLGFQSDRGVFEGPRGVTFSIFPASTLARKPPKWLVAAELLETSRLYARTVAGIESSWVEEVAALLVKRQYFEPHWERRSARVVAYERVSLYGLTLAAKRKIDYAKIDPVEARKIFIQSALVEGDFHCKAPFFAHNRRLLDSVAELENRSRRRDILVDAEAIVEFYQQRIPAQVCCAKTFEAWRKQAEVEDPRLLFFGQDTLVRDGTKPVSEQEFPSKVQVNGAAITLRYRFEPGHPRDGVSARLPLALLGQISSQRWQWLVPGLLHEKITALIRGLPKDLRRGFVPAPEFARACVEALSFGQGELLSALSEQLTRMTGVGVSVDSWQPERLPPHLHLLYEVVAPDGQVVAESRNLKSLQAALSAETRAMFNDTLHWDIERDEIVRWDFGTLPERITSVQQGATVTGFPALQDHGRSVSIRVFDTPERAASAQRHGLRRLFMLVLAKQVAYLSKHLPGFDTMCLSYASVGRPSELRDDLLKATVDRCFLVDIADLRSQQGFETLLECRKAHLITTANNLCELVGGILERYQKVRRRMTQEVRAAWLQAFADIRQQLSALIHKGFISDTPPEWLQHLPRYLKAIDRRLDKLEQGPSKDGERYAQLEPFWRAWQAASESKRDEASAQHFRWLLEEFRVSLFAQDLGTAETVSETRLKREWEKVSGGIG